MAPRRPNGTGWARTEQMEIAREVWVHAGAELVAVTEIVRAPVAAHRLTLTLMNEGRCSAADVLFALADFGLLDAQEDDFGQHGRARIFILPAGE